MPAQNNIHVSLSYPGEGVELLEHEIQPDETAIDSSTARSTLIGPEIFGPTLTRHDSSQDLTQVIQTHMDTHIVTSANGTIEEIFHTDANGTRMRLHTPLYGATEYDPNHASVVGWINPGPPRTTTAPSSFSSTSSATPLATPLVKFVQSLSGKRYCVLVKILPDYVFEDPTHDFLRFTLYIDGERRVVRTVTATQVAEVGGGSWGIAIHHGGDGGKFWFKKIKVKKGGEPESHSEWNYDLGTIRVYVERMREEEEGAVGAEDAGGWAAVGDEKDGDEEEDGWEDAEESAGEEDGEGEDEEMEDAGGKGEVEDEGQVALHEYNVDGRCLSHYTATDPPERALTSLGVVSGRCIDGEAFLIFDLKYRSADKLALVAVMPQ